LPPRPTLAYPTRVVLPATLLFVQTTDRFIKLPLERAAASAPLHADLPQFSTPRRPLPPSLRGSSMSTTTDDDAAGGSSGRQPQNPQHRSFDTLGREASVSSLRGSPLASATGSAGSGAGTGGRASIGGRRSFVQSLMPTPASQQQQQPRKAMGSGSVGGGVGGSGRSPMDLRRSISGMGFQDVAAAAASALASADITPEDAAANALAIDRCVDVCVGVLLMP
jgi:hypothetical protein